MLLGPAVKRHRLSYKRSVDPTNASSIIDQSCKVMIADMTAGVMDAVYRGVALLCSSPGKLYCGSICSGSGMGELSVHYAIARLCHVLPTRPRITPVIRFLCELDDEKADWCDSLNIGSPDILIFRNAVDMCATKAYCRKAKGKKLVPPVDLLHAGVSCKDISGLNDEAGQNLGIILEWLKKLSIADGLACADEDMPSGTTAETLLATLQYVLKHKPSMVLMENVKAFLALSNELMRLFKQMGYAVRFVEVNSRDFGVPQSRPRVYMIACNRIALPMMPQIQSSEFGGYEKRWGDSVDTTLNALKAHRRNAIDDYLLPMDSPELLSVIDDMTVPTNPDENTLIWPARHDQLFKSIDCPGRPGLKQLHAFRAALSHDTSRRMFDCVCRRQQEIILFFTLLWVKSGRLGEWAVDTSQNLWRLGKEPTPDQIPCLTGTSRIWLVRAQRLLIGEECLAIQGINRHDVCSWKMPNMVLWSLAGNAFTGTVAAAVFYAGASAGPSLS